MSKIDFRVTVIKAISRPEKNINNNVESLRTEMGSNQAELKNVVNEMQSRQDTLTVRVNEAEEQISEIEDKMIEELEIEAAWEKQIKNQEIKLEEISDRMKCSI